MKKEDRIEACKSLQEIEADLTYLLIETYKSGDVDNVLGVLRLLRPFLVVHKEICHENIK
jgi:hypothetical protein